MSDGRSEAAAKRTYRFIFQDEGRAREMSLRFGSREEARKWMRKQARKRGWKGTFRAVRSDGLELQAEKL